MYRKDQNSSILEYSKSLICKKVLASWQCLAWLYSYYILAIYGNKVAS